MFCLHKFPGGCSTLLKNIPKYVKRDLGWLNRYLDMYNGVLIMSLEEWSDPDLVLASDSCLVGCVGFSGFTVFLYCFS